MTETYRGMDREALDTAYGNTRLIGLPALMARRDDWSQRSRSFAELSGATLNIAYGAGTAHRLDIVRGQGPSPRPTIVYIHGGYWQVGEKEMYVHLGNVFAQAGFNFANIEYRLAPSATMPEIVDDVRQALDHLVQKSSEFGADDNALYLIGHSAGAHLAASHLDHPSVQGALLVSGIYDLEPIRISPINDKVGLTASDVAAYSPLHQPYRSNASTVVAVGGEELPELQRQSADYHARLLECGRESRLIVVRGRDHFSILDEVEQPHGVLAVALLDLIARRARG
jgi:arylformamidase